MIAPSTPVTDSVLPELRKQRSSALFVHIAFHIQGDKISRIYLSEASAFNYTLFPDSKKLNPLIEAWVQAYLQQSPPFPQLPLCLKHLPEFTQKVLKELEQIPMGQTVSYKELAKAAGKSNATRAVGNICHRNPYPLIIPCHRVIQSDGTIGGFAYNTELKRRLLEFEGVYTLREK